MLTHPANYYLHFHFAMPSMSEEYKGKSFSTKESGKVRRIVQEEFVNDMLVCKELRQLHGSSEMSISIW